jgi:F-type H+-transporting ATPase subunit delta
MSKDKAPAEVPRINVRDESVARVYAEALFHSAQKQRNADVVLQDLDALVNELFVADPVLEKALASGAVRRKKKDAVIEQAFNGRADAIIVDFLHVLNNHDRLGLIRAVHKAYHGLIDEQAHRMHVRVRVAAPMTPQQEERLKAELKANYQMDPVLNVKIDPELLGGMVVQVGDWVFDRSVKSRLERLRNQLMAGSYHVQDR